jgi:hypothetical protein
MSEIAAALRPHRASVFRQLRRRHRLIRMLRVAVPVVGVVALAALGAQIYLASLPGGIGAAGARFEGDRLIVERPTMTGTLSGVGRYELTAQTASTDIKDAAEVTLSAIDVDMQFAEGGSAQAHANSGLLEFSTQQLRIDETIDLRTSSGIRGEAHGGVIDAAAQSFANQGGVDFSFPDGSTFAAASMSYAATTGYWRFEQVRISVVPTPAAPTADAAP